MCEIIVFVCEQVVKGENLLVFKVSMCDSPPPPLCIYIQVKQEQEKCREQDSGVGWIVRFLLAVISCEWQLLEGMDYWTAFALRNDVNVNEDDVLIKDCEGAWI